jgi:hypothetical protein
VSHWGRGVTEKSSPTSRTLEMPHPQVVSLRLFLEALWVFTTRPANASAVNYMRMLPRRYIFCDAAPATNSPRRMLRRLVSRGPAAGGGWSIRRRLFVPLKLAL